MNTVRIPDHERAAMAARLGLPVERIPTHRTVVPCGVSAFDEAQGVSWRDQTARRKHGQRIQYQRRMAALKEREREPEPQGPSLADMQRHQMEARDDRWMRLVHGGMSHREACEAVGMCGRSADKVKKRLKGRGFSVPVKKAARPERRRSEPHPIRPDTAARDDMWLALVRGGATQMEACDALGISHNSIKGFRSRLRRRGIALPEVDRKERARKAGLVAAQAAKDRIHERDMRWMSMVNGGMKHGSAAEAVGLASRRASDIAKRLRALGHVVNTLHRGKS